MHYCADESAHQGENAVKPISDELTTISRQWSSEKTIVSSLRILQQRAVLLLLVGLVGLASTGCIIPVGGILRAQDALEGGLTTTPIIAVAPEFGVPGTALAVAGAGWQPTDIITIKIASALDELALEESITVATVAADGTFTASFAFPDAERWRIFPLVYIIAESAQNGVRASAEFRLLTAEVTNTVTPVVAAAEETATPTPTAAGPTATWTPLPTQVATQQAATPVPSLTPSRTPSQAATPTPAPAQPTRRPTPIPTPVVVVPGVNQVVVLSPALNVRSGPAVAFAIITAVPQNTVLTVLAQSRGGGWLQVQLSDGTIGWVSRYYTSGNVTPPVAQPTATSTPLPTATPVPITSVTGWLGEYFSNRDLIGPPSLVRDDQSLDFNWGSGSPAAGFPSDNFSARWTRSPYFDSGRYRFYVRVDDGVRLYLDNSLIIDQWGEDSEREFSAERDLGSGWHNLRVEYFEGRGVARIAVWWQRIDRHDDDDDDDDDFPDWKGEYYDDRDLDDRRFRRNDKEIDFNWGNGSPDDRIGDDNFSVRWTRRVDFDRGRYRFELRADDGIRFYIDGNRVLDEWRESEFDERHVLEFDLDDKHDLTVEYFERRGAARVRVEWERIGDIVTATPTFTPTPTATATTVAPTATPPVSPTDTPTSGPTPTPTLTPTVVQPSTNVQPDNGGPGTTVTVNGGGFPANTTVNVHLGSLIGVQSSANDPVRYATTTTDRTGSYSVAFALPATWPDGSTIESGQLLVLVATDDFARQATAILNYTTVAPPPTATATETATPLPTPTGPLPATPTETSTPLPTATPVETATPVPQPFVNLNPGNATPGTLVQVTGGGFPANTQLGLYLGVFDGEVRPNDAAVTFASTLTDAQGNYTMSFVMPETTPNGALIESGRIAIVVATNGFGLQAAATLDFTGTDPTATPEPTATPVVQTQSEGEPGGTIPPVSE